MKELVEFPLDGDQGSVFVEVDDAETAGDYVRVSALPDGIAGTASRTFQQAIAQLTPAVNAVMSGFSTLAAAPEQVELQFSIKLTGKAGAVFAAAQAEGQLQVTVLWKPRHDDSPGDQS